MREKDVDVFEAAVAKHFSFLQAEWNMRYAGIKAVNEDPRDSYVAAKYRQGGLRIDIVWGPLERSLGILIRLDNEELKRRERTFTWNRSLSSRAVEIHRLSCRRFISA